MPMTMSVKVWRAVRLLFIRLKGQRLRRKKPPLLGIPVYMGQQAVNCMLQGLRESVSQSVTQVPML